MIKILFPGRLNLLKYSIYFLASALLFLFFVTFVQAANLGLSPSSGSHNVGNTFNVGVTVNSAQSINAVEASLSFDNSVLSVVSISQAQSPINLWTTEPTFSNAAGTISFGGGNPSPFSGQRTLITVTFRANATGSGSVEFTSGAVTAADGQGTNIVAGMSPGTYQVQQAVTPEPIPEPTPAPTGNTPSAPSISSSTHPDSDQWYSGLDAEFSWTVPGNVTAVRLLIGEQSTAVPTVVYEPPISSRLIEDLLEDGVWYFHAQFRNSDGWGAVGTKRIQIDSTPPEDFEVTIIEEDDLMPTLAFEAEDALSGISHYHIIVGNQDPAVVSREEHEENNNQYTFTRSLPSGTQTITVRAFDMAGNSTDSEVEVEIVEGEPAPALVDPFEEREGFFEKYGVIILILLLILVIIYLLWVIFHQKNKFRSTKAISSKETKEIRAEAEKIFSALREEAEEVIAAIDNKPGLSPKERKAFEKLKNAIDVSEELISKEISDVEKSLSG